MSDVNQAVTAFIHHRRLSKETMARFSIEGALVSGRSALVYPTAVGIPRVKYLDGGEQKYGWRGNGGRAHWYGLEQARDHGIGLVYLVNGEPSVWASWQAAIAAVCRCVGEGSIPTDEQCAELREAGVREVMVVFDRDLAGRRGAAATVAALRRGGLRSAALELPEEVGPSGDVDDLHRLRGDDGLARALEMLPALPVEPATARAGALRKAPQDWPVLSADARHGLAGDIVSAIEPHTEADPAGLLVQLLVAFGSCIGRHAHVTVEAGNHYANLFAVLVGDTSKGRKGTSWQYVTRLLELADQKWFNHAVKSGLSSGEGLLEAVRDPLIRGGEIVHEGAEDKRLLAFESEFASTLRVIERQGNTLSPAIRQAWDSGSLRVMTKNSPGEATGAHISVVGHVTMDDLRRYLTRTEVGNGFANRFLWVCVRRSKVLPEGGSVDEATMAQLGDRLGSAAVVASSLGSVERDDAARDLWRAVYPVLSEGKPGLLGAVISRSEAQVMRLALVYAALNGARRISVDHMRAALVVWQYCEDSATYMRKRGLGDQWRRRAPQVDDRRLLDSKILMVQTLTDPPQGTPRRSAVAVGDQWISRMWTFLWTG
ncbi:MAG TPA: DUF3987 domain-containing protein [Thermoanaerobaculales bacterium]|nr:DUF3987 domain-containing protein [Thermoanaerobaculales bacterium]HQP88816.1 DUF3987 domain-containing protein [Thermoanaerobaculia bacterium]